MQSINKQDNLEIIQGVEINTLYKNYEIHILGYFMDVQNSDFQNLIKIQQEARVKQTLEIIDLLEKKEGIKILYDSIKAQVAEGGSIGRPHIAKAITSAGGTSSVIEAYSKYINDKSPVYVKRKTVSPQDAVEIIYDAGGVPVIAQYVGGNASMLRDGSGILVAPNEPYILASAIMKMRDKSIAEDLSVKAFNIGQHRQNKEKTIKDLVSIYQQLLYAEEK